MKITSRLALLIATLIASNLASACSRAITAPSRVADATAGSSALTTNTVWTLRSLTQAGSPEITIADCGAFTLMFGDDGKIQMRADCNRAFASYTLSGQTLSVGLIASTKAYCASAPLDNQYLALLGGENTVTSSTTTVQLSSPRGTLRFARTSP